MTVIVGMGNALLGDDGVGPAVCGELRGAGADEGIRLLDGGTQGSALLPWLIDEDAVVLVDAVRSPEPPGSVLVRRAPEPEALRGPCGDGAADLLALAIFAGLPRAAVTLVGVVAERVGPCAELTPAVRAAVPLAASVAMDEARALRGGAA